MEVGCWHAANPSPALPTPPPPAGREKLRNESRNEAGEDIAGAGGGEAGVAGAAR